MEITLDEFREEVTTIVRNHYDKTRMPLLLSHLGAEIERKQLWPTDRGSRSLKQLITETCEPDLQIVRDKRSPAYIAVVTSDLRAEIEDQITKRAGAQQSRQTRLEDLARPLLLAFCIDVQTEPVYIRRVRPFRYELGSPSQDRISEYILVDTEYRRPGLRVDNLHLMPAADKRDLENRIERWAVAHNVHPEQFSRIEELEKSQAEDERTALDRLLAAQPADVAERMLIPADIAQILNRLR